MKSFASKNSTVQKLLQTQTEPTKVQPKLIVNVPGDRYEQEADAIAERVMEKWDASKNSRSTGVIGRSIEWKRSLASNSISKLEDNVMRKAEGEYGFEAPAPFISLLKRNKGQGSALSGFTKTLMENELGANLSNVRIHTDQEATEMSKSINAKAFTYGSDIYFGSSQFNPSSSQGTYLLAHELVHVKQQSVIDNNSRQIQRSVDDWLNPYNPNLEKQYSPDLTKMSYSSLVKKAAEIQEWLDRQLAGSEKTDQLRLILNQLITEINRRNREIAAEPRRKGKRSKSQNTQISSPSDIEMPRILRERSSINYTDSNELDKEVDLITEWLRRTDISKEDRKILRIELQHIAPQFAQSQAQRSFERNSIAVARALSPSMNITDQTQKFYDVALKMDSIKPWSERPGFSYLIQGSQIFAIPTSQVDSMISEMTKNLKKSAREVRSLNESTWEEWQEWYNRNYDEHPVVGFLVSVVAGEDPMDLQEKIMPFLQNANISLSTLDNLLKNEKSPMFPRVREFVNAALHTDRARQMFYEGMNKSLTAAGNIVTGLKIAELAGLVAGAILTAGLAAPAVASFAGVGGLGLGAVGTTIVTTTGTGLIVGTGGALQAGMPGFIGSKLAGEDTEDAVRYSKSRAWEGFKVTAPIGVGAGFTRAFGSAIGLGSEGLTIGQTYVRGGLAGAGGNFFAGTTGAALEGKGFAGSLKAGLFSVPSGFAGGTLGAASNSIANPAWRQAFLTIGSTAIGAGDAALRGGSIQDIFLGAGMGFVSSGGSLTAKQDAAVQNWGAAQGRSVQRGVQALMLGTDLGLGLRFSFGSSVASRPVAAVMETTGSSPNANIEVSAPMPEASQSILPGSTASVPSIPAAMSSSPATVPVINLAASTIPAASQSANPSPVNSPVINLRNAVPDASDVLTVNVNQQQYHNILGHAYPSQAFNEITTLVDTIGQSAAVLAIQNPAFVSAYQNGNMTLAGTLFHSAARNAAVQLSPSLPAGWTLAAEFVIQAGRGGSRADLLFTGPNNEVLEFDWKTRGGSALSYGSRQEMTRHAGQIRANVQGTLTTQESRSWVDYVRPFLGGPR